MMKVFETNAVGPLLVAQQFVPLLKTPSRSKDAGFPLSTSENFYELLYEKLGGNFPTP
jgi:hypothetical protein